MPVHFSEFQENWIIGEDSQELVKATNNVKTTGKSPKPACVHRGCTCCDEDPFSFRPQFHARVYALRKVRRTPNVLSKVHRTPNVLSMCGRVRHIVEALEPSSCAYDDKGPTTGLARCAPRTVAGVRAIHQ